MFPHTNVFVLARCFHKWDECVEITYMRTADEIRNDDGKKSGLNGIGRAMTRLSSRLEAGHLCVSCSRLRIVSNFGQN